MEFNGGEAAGPEARQALLLELAPERKAFPSYLFETPRLARFLQGHAGSVEEAAAHYRQMLAWRKEANMEERRKKTEGKPWSPDSVPGLRPLLETMSADVGSYAPSGDLIWAQGDGNARLDKIMNVSDEELYGIFYSMCELREEHLDKLSEESGKLVKVIQMRDLSGFSVSQLLKDRAIMGRLKEVLRVVNLAYPECVRSLVLMNLPTGFNLLWTALRPLLNARILSKFVFLSKDNYIEELAVIVGIQGLEALCRVRLPRSARDGAAVSFDVAAGASQFWCKQLKAGEVASWTFGIGPGGANCSLMFHASFVCDYPYAFDRGQSASVEGQRSAGTFQARSDGLLWLTWSNPGKWSRSKRVEGLRVTVAEPRALLPGSPPRDDVARRSVIHRQPDCGSGCFSFLVSRGRRGSPSRSQAMRPERSSAQLPSQVRASSKNGTRALCQQLAPSKAEPAETTDGSFLQVLTAIVLTIAVLVHLFQLFQEQVAQALPV